jgi:hypothetical protein
VKAASPVRADKFEIYLRVRVHYYSFQRNKHTKHLYNGYLCLSVLCLPKLLGLVFLGSFIVYAVLIEIIMHA